MKWFFDTYNIMTKKQIKNFKQIQQNYASKTLVTPSINKPTIYICD